MDDAVSNTSRNPSYVFLMMFVGFLVGLLGGGYLAATYSKRTVEDFVVWLLACSAIGCLSPPVVYQAYRCLSFFAGQESEEDEPLSVEVEVDVVDAGTVSRSPESEKGKN